MGVRERVVPGQYDRSTATPNERCISPERKARDTRHGASTVLSLALYESERILRMSLLRKVSVCLPLSLCLLRSGAFPAGAQPGMFTTLHSFNLTDGAFANSGVIQGKDGALYGVTWQGGSGYGTVYRLAGDGSSFSTLHIFNWSDGAFPLDRLMQSSDGSLYGTTTYDGDGYGTVYRMATDGSGLRTLHSFITPDHVRDCCKAVMAHCTAPEVAETMAAAPCSLLCRPSFGPECCSRSTRTERPCSNREAQSL